MVRDDLLIAAKRAAAERAAALVEPGMKVGLGTGSTVAFLLDALGARVAAGLRFVGTPTSEATRLRAMELGLSLVSLDEAPHLDLTIDGADEFDPQLRLIKGGGGALLREKIVAAASDRMVAIVDGSKRVNTLGRFPLPVEIAPFGAQAIRLGVEAAAARAGCHGPIEMRRREGHAFVTDGGHYILDCAFGTIPDPEALAAELASTPGVMGHGLFIGMAKAVVMAEESGVTIFGTLDGKQPG